MRNPKLAAILALSVDENRKEKACLIEDVIKVKRLLYGMGDTQHNEFLTDKTAVELYDTLHELDHTALRLAYKGYEKRVNELRLTMILSCYED